MTTPPPAAFRAARVIQSCDLTVEKAAQVIDRETGVGELVAALEEAKFVLEFPVNARTSEALAKINQALARHQQRSQPKP
jgi:hypothetical protein